MADSGGIQHGKMRRPQIPLISEAPNQGGTPHTRDLLARAAKQKSASLPFRGPLVQALPPPCCWVGQHPPPPPGKARQPWGRMGKRGRNRNIHLREQPSPPTLAPEHPLSQKWDARTRRSGCALPAVPAPAPCPAPGTAVGGC